MVKTKKLNKHLGGFTNAVSSAANTTVNKAKSNPIATIVILLLVVLVYFSLFVVFFYQLLPAVDCRSTKGPVIVNVTLVRRKYKMVLSSNLVSQIKTFLMRDGVEDEPYYF